MSVLLNVVFAFGLVSWLGQLMALAAMVIVEDDRVTKNLIRWLIIPYGWVGLLYKYYKTVDD